MRKKRRSLVWALLVPVVVPFLGLMGPVEFGIWLVMIGGWLWTFFDRSKRRDVPPA